MCITELISYHRLYSYKVGSSFLLKRGSLIWEEDSELTRVKTMHSFEIRVILFLRYKYDSPLPLIPELMLINLS